jgi:hypothetical protein
MSNSSKINRMSIKYTNIFHCKTVKNLPKMGLNHQATLNYVPQFALLLGNREAMHPILRLLNV